MYLNKISSFIWELYSEVVTPQAQSSSYMYIWFQKFIAYLSDMLFGF